VAAIAAGNTAVLKPSEIGKATSQQTAEMVPKCLDPAAVSVVLGGIPETTALLAQKWDLIFFTGSPPVGKIIHKAAAQNLTPAVLELGGKNPTIVHSSANIRTAARRIAFGRFVNSGHICTAPDHVLVWPEVKDELVAELKQAIRDFYGEDPKQSPDYGRVINRKNFDRLAGLIGSGTVAAGGQTDPDELYIAPTVLVDVPVDSPIMQEEVFGPILPVLEIDSVQAVIDWVNERPRPLGLYVFAEDEDVAERILEATNSGDACLNDCSVHPLVLPSAYATFGSRLGAVSLAGRAGSVMPHHLATRPAGPPHAVPDPRCHHRDPAPRLAQCVSAYPVMAQPGLVLASPPPAGPGPDASGIGYAGLDQADQQPADLRQRVADHTGIAGADPFFTAWGLLAASQASASVDKVIWAYQAPPGADLILVEPGLALGCCGHSSICQRLPAARARSAVLDRRGP
jgi:Aldehyde dehydrogenase family